MRNTASALALVAALGLGSAAAAQDMAGAGKGLYLGAGIGASIPRDSDVSASGVDSEAELDTSYGLMGAIGYAYPNNFRSEIELGWRENDIDGVSGATASGGDVNVLHGMLNLYYDIPGMGRFTPYLGAGIGAARVSVDAFATNGPFGASTDDSDVVFGYQGIAGVGYQLTDNLGLFADYRYFATTDADLRTSAGADIEADYSEHRILVGLRWFFGAPAKKMEPTPAAAPAPMPAPAPAPAPAAQAPAPQPARNYLVFFDFDRADLKPDALSIVRQAAQNFPKTTGVTRIEATGHADRSGPDAYNMRLSQRRAEAVRAELIRQGIPANQITIAAKGEREPLVQTPDGVREPQNRRVEIVLR